MPRGKPNTTKPKSTAPAAQPQVQQAQAQAPSLANSPRRPVPPVAMRHMVDTGDMATGQEGDATMDTRGDARITHPVIEVPDGPVSKDKMAALAFDAEFVTVSVAESNSDYPEPCVSTWVNGRHQLFVRGCDITCRRMFVAALARSRPQSYGNVEYVDADGVRQIKWPKRTSQRFPFSVIRDDNPNGRAWLRKILQEA